MSDACGSVHDLEAAHVPVLVHHHRMPSTKGIHPARGQLPLVPKDNGGLPLGGHRRSRTLNWSRAASRTSARLLSTPPSTASAPCRGLSPTSMWRLADRSGPHPGILFCCTIPKRRKCPVNNTTGMPLKGSSRSPSASGASGRLRRAWQPEHTGPSISMSLTVCGLCEHPPRHKHD